MTEKTVKKMIEKKAIVYWKPRGHDRIGNYSPKVYGRANGINFGIISVITPYESRKTTCHLEWVHECKNPEDIQWFEDQEKKWQERK